MQRNSERVLIHSFRDRLIDLDNTKLRSSHVLIRMSESRLHFGAEIDEEIRQQEPSDCKKKATKILTIRLLLTDP